MTKRWQRRDGGGWRTRERDSFTQLSDSHGLMVDSWGNLYVADSRNDRIMRWCKGLKEGSLVVGGNRKGDHPNQLYGPKGLSFDGQGHLYVVDGGNHRVHKFVVEDN